MDNKEDRALKVNKKKLLILGPNCLTQEQVKLGLDWISLIVLLGLCFGLKKRVDSRGQTRAQTLLEETKE